MNELAIQSVSGLLTVAPRCEVSIRTATMGDLPFLDALQKKHSKALGYFPTKQFEGYIEMGAVLIAVGATLVSPGMARAGDEGETSLAPTGYIISRDRYLKRDELGVIYQLCVAPGDQRKLIGAALVRETFNRSAYGCRLYCCWCAQDLAANYFWESLGFVPIAFRGGSGKKKRVHIFWQRRIREGDTGEKATPWWFPAKTDQGAMREDRLVLPIPPGLRWSDEMPVLKVEGTEPQRHEGTKDKRVRSPEVGEKVGPQEPTKKPRAAVQFGVPTARPAAPVAPDPQPQPACTERSRSEPKPAKTPRPKEKIDPQLVAKARELRDRYLEQVNSGTFQLESRGRYEVARALPADGPTPAPTLLLPAA